MSTTTNEEKKITEMNGEEVIELAKKLSYVALRTMSQKSGDKKMQDLQIAICRYPNCNMDAQDIVAQACLEIVYYRDAQAEDIGKEVLKAIHRYVYSQQRKATENEMKTLYIDDIDAGKIINVNNEISKLLDCVVIDEVINNISAELTYSQRRVLRLWAKGNTQETIAKKLRVTQQTISKHQKAIQTAGKRLYPNGIDF